MAKYFDCCRICLKTTDSCKSIFNLYFDSFVYSNIIGDFTGVQIYENEKLPIQICDDCERLLISSYEFRKQTISSNEILNDFLENETDIKIELEPQIKIEEVDFSDSQSYKEDSDSSFVPEEEQETTSKSKKKKTKKQEPKSDKIKKTKTKSDKPPVKRIYRRNKSAPMKCTLCNITLPNYTAYNLHRRLEHHKISVCSTCGKSVTKCNMTQHLQTHSESKDFKCTICDKAFKTNSRLSAHITATHNRTLRYKCDHCDQMFIHFNGKRSHTDRIHLNLKRYECKICPSKFFESNELKFHVIRKHTGEMKHKCDICENYFASSTLLKYHKRIHMEVKLFNCEVCGKGFANKSGLTRHLKIHKGIKRPSASRRMESELPAIDENLLFI